MLELNDLRNDPDKPSTHGTWSVKFPLSRWITSWLDKRREDKKRKLIQHQEAYAKAVRMKQHEDAAIRQRLKASKNPEIEILKHKTKKQEVV